MTALDIETVDPEWQRRGAGRMLVKWGTAIADEMGVAVKGFLLFALIVSIYRNGMEANPEPVDCRGGI